MVSRKFRHTTPHGAMMGKTRENGLAQKEQEVQTLKDGIRILSRAIHQKEEDQNYTWLNHFAKGHKSGPAFLFFVLFQELQIISFPFVR